MSSDVMAIRHKVGDLISIDTRKIENRVLCLQRTIFVSFHPSKHLVPRESTDWLVLG